MTTADDIVVSRCTVRVVRHGGWSWGPEPRRLVDQVLAALPGLIAERLAGLSPLDGSDLEITEPVRIVVSLTLADLLADRFDPLQQVATSLPPLPPLQPHVPVRPQRTHLPDRTPALLALAQPVTPAQFLARLLQRGELGQFLALLPADTLEAWYQALTAPSAEAPGTPAGPPALPAVPTDRLPAGTGHPASEVPISPPEAAGTPETVRSRQLRDAITAIASRASQRTPIRLLGPGDSGSGSHDRPAPADPAPAGPAPASPQPPRTGAVPIPAAGAGTASTSRAASAPEADTSPAPPGGTAPASRAVPVGQMASAPGATAPLYAASGPLYAASGPLYAASGPLYAASGPLYAASGPLYAASGPPYAASGPPPATDVEVASALPFLLLGPLAQTGYLPALAPALEAVGLQAQTAAFAAALAYTVLGPLERGWRRHPEDLIAAAAFAGLAAPVPGQALTKFARAASSALPALDAVVTRALAEGHTPGEPLILAGAGEGTLLLDREGLFPLAWADTVAGLLPAWRMCGSPPVLVAPTALGALRGLTAAGATFVVATPPGRGERWRRLPPHRLWTNGDDPALARIAAGSQQATGLAADLVQGLAAERAAVPLAAGPALGRSLLLAAGLGLGTLAWTLWREREPTDPLLALERFADLSALVSFEPHRVRVRLPLGPRHADLSAHGLLADVPGVPWLGGRVVEFSGG